MKKLMLGLALSAVMSLPAGADTLLLDAINAAPGNTAGGTMRPSRGASMATVTARFGEPGDKKPAVGEPPITRWVYPGYTVYFEHDRVIDVVVHR